MRGKWFLWLVAALIGSALAFPPMTLAAEKKTAEKAKPKAQSATGEVVSVDAKMGMLVVKVKDKEMNFTAEAKAVKKVKAGDLVTVSYREEEGKMVASSVKAAKKRAAKKS